MNPVSPRSVVNFHTFGPVDSLGTNLWTPLGGVDQPRSVRGCDLRWSTGPRGRSRKVDHPCHPLADLGKHLPTIARKVLMAGSGPPIPPESWSTALATPEKPRAKWSGPGGPPYGGRSPLDQTAPGRPRLVATSTTESTTDTDTHRDHQETAP